MAISSSYKRSFQDTVEEVSTGQTNTINEGVAEFWDFLGGLRGTPFVEYTSGSALVEQSSSTFSGAGGISLSTQTTSSTACAAITTDIFMLGPEALTQYQVRLKLPILATSAQNYNAKAGLMSSAAWQTASGYSQVESGALFYYDFSQSNNWICKCGTAGVITTVITTTAVSTDDVYLKIDLSSTEAAFYIDGVQVATIDTNLPNGVSDYMSCSATIQKSNGTSSRQMLIDAIKFKRKLSTIREFIN